MKSDQRRPDRGILAAVRYQLSAAEMRLLLLMLGTVHKGDADGKTYRLSLSDFVEGKAETAAQDLRRAAKVTKSLMGKILELDSEDECLQVSLLSSVRYLGSNGYLEFRFDPALKPYLFDLREGFSEHDIRNMVPCRSAYSLRMYQFLKDVRGRGDWIVEVDELRRRLGTGNKYTLYADFKRFVLKTAERELLQHTDLGFRFQEIRVGKKVHALQFRFATKAGRPRGTPTLGRVVLPPAPAVPEKRQPVEVPIPVEGMLISRPKQVVGVPERMQAEPGGGVSAKTPAARARGRHYQYIDGVLTQDGEEIWLDELADE